MLLIFSAVSGSGKIVKPVGYLDDPPEDIDWTSAINRVVDWYGMDITANGHTGQLESVEDTNSDGLVGHCDNVVINWRNLKTRQPYWTYHFEKGEYVDDPDDPDYGAWKFEFDYKLKSKPIPKIEKNVCWVDDDNKAGPWDGSYSNPYRTIQDAVTELEIVAPAGVIHDIYVEPGSYPRWHYD